MRAHGRVTSSYSAATQAEPQHEQNQKHNIESEGFEGRGRVWRMCILQYATRTAHNMREHDGTYLDVRLSGSWALEDEPR